MIQALMMELRSKATKDDLVPYMRKIETLELSKLQSR